MVRFCCYYHRDNKYNDVINELNIVKTTETIKDLNAFLQKHQKQRVNLCINDLNDFYENGIKQLDALENKSNLYIRLEKDAAAPIDSILQDELKTRQIPFYYNQVVDNWDVLNGLIAEGVSDVFIGNSLGFELDQVAEVAHAENVKVRVYPNVAQSTWSQSESITKFFIRPEDTMLYSLYVDCFELFELPSTTLTNPETFYEIYKIDKKWNGDLSTIILFLNESIDNRLLNTEGTNRWGEIRIKCGKKCAKGRQCRICHRLVEMTEAFSEKEKLMDKFLSKK